MSDFWVLVITIISGYKEAVILGIAVCYPHPPPHYKPVPWGKDASWFISVQLRFTSYVEYIYHDYSKYINLSISFHKYFKQCFLYVD